MPQFNLPDPGEGLVEAEIVTWKVKVGDQVKVNDIVVEIETAKSLVELPIPWAGTVQEILVEEGETVEVGSPIIVIDTGDGGGAPAGGATGAESASASGAESAGASGAESAGASGEQAAAGGETSGTAEPGTLAAPGEATPAPREAVLVGYGPSAAATQRRARKSAASAQDATPEPEAPQGPSLAKPPVRKYAKDKGVDLALVRPSREDGVITRADVDAFLSGGQAAGGQASAGAGAGAGVAASGAEAAGAAGAGAAGAGAVAAAGGLGAAATAGGALSGDVAAAAGGGTTPGTGEAAPSVPAYTPPVFDRAGERETRTPIKGVRKVTAQAMVGSAFTAPHVTEFITVDVSATMELVERLKNDREFRGARVNPMLLVAKAVCLAVKRNPGMIAVWDEDAQEIVQKNYVNLGIAAATPRGLMVPNIKDADLMDLRQLADAMTNLVETARAGRTQPAEMSGGSITITNVGVFGIDNGTPIINPGESAIVGFGAVRRQPWVVTGPDGTEQIVPRWITQLAVSFDHRLIDGELGSRFLADLAALLEDPGRALVWA